MSEIEKKKIQKVQNLKPIIKRPQMHRNVKMKGLKVTNLKKLTVLVKLGQFSREKKHSIPLRTLD